MPVLPRTAVVVVHGIGEQRPMETLRRFVGLRNGSDDDGILTNEDREHAFVNPDGIGRRTYLRRISLDHTHLLVDEDLGSLSRSQYRRATHFYEYYWAYRFRETTWRHLTGWFIGLLTTKREDVDTERLLGPDRNVEGERAEALRLRACGVAFLAVLFVAVGYLVLTTAKHPLSWVDKPSTWILVVDAVVALGAVVGALVVGDNAGLILLVRIGIAIPAAIVAAIVAALCLLAKWDSGDGVAGLIAIACLAVGGLILGVVRKARHVGVLFVLVGLAILFWQFWNHVESLLPAISVGGISGVATVVLGVVGGVLFKTVGDASRYLSNKPDDITEREKIRAGLVDILRALHNRRNAFTGLPVYDRVVLVGHSLGSVIAYDALQAFWIEQNQHLRFPDPKSKQQPWPTGALAVDLESLRDLPVSCPFELESPPGAPVAAPGVREMSPFQLRPGSIANADKLQKWVDAQRRLQIAFKADRIWTGSATPSVPKGRWIISDLITLGSPLTYADVLLADGRTELDGLKESRMLLTAPPVLQSTQDKYPFRYRTWRGTRYESRLHHAAAFALTTWTNIYFNHDPVGGPLAPHFGNGVKDIRVAAKRRARIRTAMARMPHTEYWHATDKNREYTGLVQALLHSIIVRQGSVVIVKTSDDAQLAAFQASVEKFLCEDQVEPATGFVELRVTVQRTLKHGKSVPRSVWLGKSPWFKVSDLSNVADAAVAVGATITGSDRPSETTDGSTEEQLRPTPPSSADGVVGDMSEPDEESELTSGD